MIYLDYQATTPVAPEVAETMRPWIADKFANPHSPSRWGREAAAAIEVARKQVEEAIGLSGGSLAFTGSATEALNWALKGTMERIGRERNRIVTVATEHAAVLDSAEWLAGQGYDLTLLPVGADGLIDLDQLAENLDDRVAIVAVMLVNNEIGVVQPTERIAALAHNFGALWIRKGCEPAPLIHGGGQEQGLRSGTLSPALCVGFGAAAKLAADHVPANRLHVEALWAAALDALGPDWTVNGSPDRRYHGNLNIRREGLDGARLISDLRDIAFSLGSACASGSGRPSHVLRALGLSDREARSSIRLGFGRYTTVEELADACRRIAAAARAQQDMAA